MLNRKLLVGLPALLAALAVASSASARPVAETPADDAVVLPSRVANAIGRLDASLTNAEEHVDEEEYAKAIVSLRSVRRNLSAVEKAARAQMNAVPADPEAESTAGPDAVIAVLTAEQAVITRAAGLFNGNSGTLVTALASTLTTALVVRDRLLNAVLALDPAGAGADYADGMADTVDGYADELANLSEALANDTLSAGGKSALNSALARSQATSNKVNAAFGGGE
jgi:hypothetical protein